MEKLLEWDEGDGYFNATFNGSGDGTITFKSAINKGIDREKSVTVACNDGVNDTSVTITVRQTGLREVFEPTDGFILNDGGTFNVLKA